MFVKQLIRNEQEYWEFVWPFIDWSGNPNKSLWREEDLPKLKPFFDTQNCRPNIEWTQEIEKSFDFYEECCEEYGNRNRELRDAVSRVSADDILEVFGYERPDFDEDNEDDYTKDKPLTLDKDFDATFPFVVIGDIHCGWDRSGNITILSVYHVSLKDFA